MLRGRPNLSSAALLSEPSLASQGLDPRYDIAEVSVTGNAASATLKEYGFGGFNFTDYMHLLKRDGQWKIISKTFSTF